MPRGVPKNPTASHRSVIVRVEQNLNRLVGAQLVLVEALTALVEKASNPLVVATATMQPQPQQPHPAPRDAIPDATPGFAPSLVAQKPTVPRGTAVDRKHAIASAAIKRAAILQQQQQRREDAARADDLAPRGTEPSSSLHRAMLEELAAEDSDPHEFAAGSIIDTEIELTDDNPPRDINHAPLGFAPDTHRTWRALNQPAGDGVALNSAAHPVDYLDAVNETVIHDASTNNAAPITTDPVEEMYAELRSYQDEDDTPPPPLDDSEIWGKRIHTWRSSKLWMDAWGPRPGQEGCRIPPAMLNGRG